MHKCKIRYIKNTDLHCGHIESIANGGSDGIIMLGLNSTYFFYKINTFI